MQSVSNNTNYPSVCLMAVNDEEVFNRFKNITEYTQILEHTSFEVGLEYKNIIDKQTSGLLKKYYNKFKTNDIYGGANICDYRDGILISPSTLRYIKVLSDLIVNFGDLNNFKIAEIGGGYGGQCKIINDVFKIKDYHIIDISEANKLTDKYLKNLKVENFRVSSYDELMVEKYDLVISNYAYTELDRSLQNLYFDKIINNSEKGYFTCNFIIDFAIGGNFDTYSKNELLNMKKNSKVIPEEPLTAPTNFILLW